MDGLEGTYEGTVEMKGLLPEMMRANTGAVEVADLKDYVGKSEFADQDVIVFTTVKRTTNSINNFNYSDLRFNCSVKETTKDGKTTKSTGWSRDPDYGTTEAGGESHPDRIYWSDATSPHTFIGYCAPQQRSGTFDWVKKTVESIDTYYGSLGDPTVSGYIDYQSDYDSDTPKTMTRSGNEKLREDDILLTYSTEIKAEDAIAKLQFHHALAQVRVIVNISDFAAGGGVDTLSVVSNMVLKDMLTRYKWSQNGCAVRKLYSRDNADLGITDYDQKKNVKLWIPKPAGDGERSSKTFTFYGLAVPTQYGESDRLEFSFDVTYPNPMKPTEMQTKQYTAGISGLHFDSGKCTTISISLNHRNEKMTVGAEYMDWEFVDNPDQGSLKKNSTFLDTTDRSKVTIHGDTGATVDDATWLYNKDGNVVDVYGNDGTETKPFTISTAEQLLSFAYEVAEGYGFTGKYVKLDADIHLQSTETVDSLIRNKKYVDKEGVQFLNWPGIGNATNKFKGTFLGTGRYITHLYGSALFKYVGANAVIRDLNLSDVVRVSDNGALVENNEGFLCACRVEGAVQSALEYVGSLCGNNASTGVIFACTHNGLVKGTASEARVGGLLGQNYGVIAVSYHTGAIEGKYTYGDVVSEGSTGVIHACYYNSTLAKPNRTVDAEHVNGRTLGQMQSKSFVTTDLNGNITGMPADVKSHISSAYQTIINSYHFVFTPGAYPRVEKQ